MKKFISVFRHCAKAPKHQLCYGCTSRRVLINVASRILLSCQNMATDDSWRESTVTVVRGKEVQLCRLTSRDLDLARQWCTIGRRTGMNQSSCTIVLLENTIRSLRWVFIQCQAGCMLLSHQSVATYNLLLCCEQFHRRICSVVQPFYTRFTRILSYLAPRKQTLASSRQREISTNFSTQPELSFIEIIRKYNV